MNRSIPLAIGGLLTLSLVGISTHPGHSQPAGVDNAEHSTEGVEMEVPAGTFFVLETDADSKRVSIEGETRVEGDATILLGKSAPPINHNPRESFLLWREAHRADTIRLRVRHSRITVARGQPNYPSHVFIKPLPSAAAGK